MKSGLVPENLLSVAYDLSASILSSTRHLSVTACGRDAKACRNTLFLTTICYSFGRELSALQTDCSALLRINS